MPNRSGQPSDAAGAYTLDVSLPVEETLNRLRKNIDDIGIFDAHRLFVRNHPFCGKIHDHQFELLKRNWYSNGYTRILYAKVEPWETGGSRITGLFKVFPLVNWIVAFVQGMMYFAIAYLLILLIFDKGNRSPWQYIELGVFLFNLILVHVICWWLKTLGEKDEASVRQFLQDLYK
jgi:hypothetical protein